MHLFMDVFDLVAGSLKLLINFAPLAKLNFSDDSDGAHLFEVQNIVDRQIISGCDELRRTETRHEEIWRGKYCGKWGAAEISSCSILFILEPTYHNLSLAICQAAGAKEPLPNNAMIHRSPPFQFLTPSCRLC